jgi:phenylacetate-coenzyme A ligase PaaK-like adenylate-forming protein
MMEDPSYKPKTYLMNEVIPGEKYELVITVLKGGAFARYRVGDIYRCVGLTNREDNTKIPRFEYIDRVPSIIDIAGFTRISANGIRNAIALSGLPIKNWVAVKEYNEENHPYLHMYVEISTQDLVGRAMSTDILKEILTTYFKYIDHDYSDLKKIIGMDPLKVSILKCGSFAAYEERNKKPIPNMQPAFFELKDLLQK